MNASTVRHLRRATKVVGIVGVAIVAIFVCLALAGVPLPGGINQPEQSASKESDERKDAQEGRTASPHAPKYDVQARTDKLHELWKKALEAAAVRKDTKACQKGLADYRTMLSQQPPTVATELEKFNGKSEWKLPAHTNFMDLSHTVYACNWAAKVNQLDSLYPDTSSLRALQALDDSSKEFLNDQNKLCFDLLKVDYVALHGQASAGGHVWLAMNGLVTPTELSDRQFATLCDYKLPAS